MKPKEYIKAYRLTEANLSVDWVAFKNDLLSDFGAMVEYLQESRQLNETRMKTLKLDFEAKVESILRQSPTYQDSITKIYQEIRKEAINPLDQKLFGEARRQRAQARAERNREEFNFYNSFFQDLLFSLLVGRQTAPVASFTVLGLDSSATSEMVQKKYRELVSIHHPDKGGKAEDFIKLTEAKNKCLAFLKA
jgi:hypothetical protein